jgi:hypothetical protein
MLEQQFNLPTQEAITAEIAPILIALKRLEERLTETPTEKKFYRNKDLKKKFRLSDNTISKYREANIIPFTTLGDVHFYPVDKLNAVLEMNSNYILVKT